MPHRYSHSRRKDSEKARSTFHHFHVRFHPHTSSVRTSTWTCYVRCLRARHWVIGEKILAQGRQCSAAERQVCDSRCEFTPASVCRSLCRNNIAAKELCKTVITPLIHFTDISQFIIAQLQYWCKKHKGILNLKMRLLGWLDVSSQTSSTSISSSRRRPPKQTSF